MPDIDDWLGDEYQILRILGRGANGSVVLARHRPLDRLVAVKSISGTALLGAAADRIQREARILASLHRPTIVAVYQLLVRPGALSIVMEYLPGGDLERVLAEGELDTSTAISVLTQVADALSAASAAGVVHRDVKPANVLLDGRGRAVLADFGLARFPGSSTMFRTSAGQLTGTPQFMAPEQIKNPGAAAGAIDAYAFGVLAYRLLTGGYPFSAGTVADLYEAHRSGVPIPAQRLRPGFPRAAERWLLEALAKDPARRPGPDRLAAMLAGVPVPAWDAAAPIAGLSNPPDATGVDPEETVVVEPTGWSPPSRGSGPTPVIRHPDAEQWIVPQAPRLPPARRWRSRSTLLLLVVLGGVLGGVAFYLAILR